QEHRRSSGVSGMSVGRPSLLLLRGWIDCLRHGAAFDHFDLCLLTLATDKLTQVLRADLSIRIKQPAAIATASASHDRNLSRTKAHVVRRRIAVVRLLGGIELVRKVQS